MRFKARFTTLPKHTCPTRQRMRENFIHKFGDLYRRNPATFPLNFFKEIISIFHDLVFVFYLYHGTLFMYNTNRHQHLSQTMMSSNPCIYMYYGVEAIKRQTRAAYCCLVADQSPWMWAWTVAYKLYARSGCDTKAAL